MAKNIILIGPSGSGKTTLAAKLAETGVFAHIDTDQVLEAGTGMSPAQIFANQGEEAFRTLETALITAMINPQNSASNSDTAGDTERPFVMATGGGLPCTPGNFEILQNLGITIYLQADAQTLAKRVVESKAERPMLASKDEEEKTDLSKRIQDLLDKRESTYKRASHTVNTAGISVSEAVDKIYEIVESGK